MWALLPLLLGAARAKDITVRVDDLVNTNIGDIQGKGMQVYGHHYLGVSDQLTVRELIAKANFFGKTLTNAPKSVEARIGAHRGTSPNGQPIREFQDWSWLADSSAVEMRDYSPDNGVWLFEHWNEMRRNANLEFVQAHYNGDQLDPESTLASNGIGDMSAVMLVMREDIGDLYEASSSNRVGVEVHVGKAGQQTWKTEFYVTEDLWNVFNVICHHYGRSMSDSSFEVSDGRYALHPSDYYRLREEKLETPSYEYDYPTIGTASRGGKMETVGRMHAYDFRNKMVVILHKASEAGRSRW